MEQQQTNYWTCNECGELFNKEIDEYCKRCGWLKKYNLSDEEKRKEAILDIKKHWKLFQEEDGKVNGKTIKELLGENWKSEINNKKRGNIIDERNRLIELIKNSVV